MYDKLFGRDTSDETPSTNKSKLGLNVSSHMSREAFDRLDNDTKFEVIESYQRTMGTVDKTYQTIIQEQNRQIDILRGRAEYAEQQLKEFKMGRREKI